MRLLLDDFDAAAAAVAVDADPCHCPFVDSKSDYSSLLMLVAIAHLYSERTRVKLGGFAIDEMNKLVKSHLKYTSIDT